MERLVNEIKALAPEINESKLRKILESYVIRDKNSYTNNGGLPKELNLFLKSMESAGRSKGSIDLYRLRLKDFLLNINVTIQDLNPDDIRDYLKNVKERRNISDRTLDNCRTIVYSFLEWCCNEKYLQSNPVRNVLRIKYSSKERGSLSGKDREKLFCAATTLRDRAMLEFMYSTGCRVSELCNAKLSDLDWNRQEVELFGKGKKYRTSYISDKCFYHLKKYLDSRTDDCPYLFVSEKGGTKPIKKGAVELRIKELSKASGVKAYPHLIRHTTATDCINRGMPVEIVQQILGHSNINTTMIYAHNSEDRVKAAHKKCIN